MFTTDFLTVVAQSVFGSEHSTLLPDSWWLTFNDEDGEELTARVEVPNTDDMWEPTINGIANADDIIVTAGDDYTIHSVSLWTAETDGVEAVKIVLPAPIEVASESTILFAPGDFVVVVA